jgi:hypothetical protein
MNRRLLGAAASLAGAGLLAWTGWGAYLNRTTERVPYTEIGRAGDVEFREYPEAVLVRTRAESEEAAFGRLFEYIGGANRASEAVSMTAPVATNGKRTPGGASDEAGSGANGASGEAAVSEEVSMTAPVRTDQGDEAARMGFFLPAEYTPESAPRPTDPRRLDCSIRWSGRASRRSTSRPCFGTTIPTRRRSCGTTRCVSRSSRPPGTTRTVETDNA